MNEKTQQEIDKAAAVKVYRNQIRLKFSLMADEAIYKTLPEVIRRIDDAQLRGEALELNPGEVFDEIYGT